MKKSARKKKNVFHEHKPETIQVYEPVTVTVEKPNVLKRIFSKRLVQIIIALLIVALIVGGGYYQLRKLEDAPISDKDAAAEVKSLVKEVGEKMVLPEGEVPTIATVSDVSKLQSQPFFKSAQNGDKVLLYGSIKQAILYRTSIHKIVAVSNLTLPEDINSSPSASTTNTATATKTPLKVSILNSTKEVGLAKKAVALIAKDKATITTGNSEGEYKGTTVTVIGKDKNIAESQLKDLVSGFTKVSPTISSLPSGEAPPAGAEVVIILGSDFSEAY